MLTQTPEEQAAIAAREKQEREAQTKREEAERAEREKQGIIMTHEEMREIATSMGIPMPPK